jgi:protocatechuate 3,4-dioxygenase beta subunit
MKTILLITVSILYFQWKNNIHADNKSSSVPHQERVTSGLPIGADCPAFDPKHVWGPDKGTSACPMCKYGYQQGVMIWMNTDNWDNISPLVIALDKEIQRKGLNRIRVFLIYMNSQKKSKLEVEDMLEKFSQKAGLTQAAVTYIPNPSDPRQQVYITSIPIQK